MGFLSLSETFWAIWQKLYILNPHPPLLVRCDSHYTVRTTLLANYAVIEEVIYTVCGLGIWAYGEFFFQGDTAASGLHKIRVTTVQIIAAYRYSSLFKAGKIPHGPKEICFIILL